MRTESYPVSSAKTVIGMAKYSQFETLDEAVAHFGGGQAGIDVVLKRLNAQVKTDEMNKVRSEFATGPSKEALRNKAFANIASPERVGELQAAAGDQVKIELLVNTEIERLQKEWESQRDQRAREAAELAKAAGVTGGEENGGVE